MGMRALRESIGMVFPIRIRATMNRLPDIIIAGMENDGAGNVGSEVKPMALRDAFPQTPFGFFAFLLLQQKEWTGTAFGVKTARPFCCLQAPVGARVASPQSPLLR